jgi:Rrf2 family transcriptional regulator, nitric oxide-sensitive transcriptional repressor
MIPKTAEYALRAVVLLARSGERPLSAEEIARDGRVPRRYAHKVLQALGRAGLVRSQPGPGGGYALLRRPENLTILDVVAAVEPIPRIRRCPLGLKTHERLCPLHRELDEAYETMEKAFARVTIAQVLDQAGEVPPLCELHEAGTDGDGPCRHSGRRTESSKTDPQTPCCRERKPS